MLKARHEMENRTTESIVCFRNSFSIGSAVTDKPPGDYRISREEELITEASCAAFRTVSISIQIPSLGTPSLTKQFFDIFGDDLDFALQRDEELSNSRIDPVRRPTVSMAERARNFDPGGEKDR